ncbi:hypothetical protein BJY52DRAFT_178089 [Lactarius psammicola]|nr:hypothetical protein BJY52DRAFT_178089 [Lactarius psammicola]
MRQPARTSNLLFLYFFLFSLPFRCFSVHGDRNPHLLKKKRPVSYVAKTLNRDGRGRKRVSMAHHVHVRNPSCVPPTTAALRRPVVSQSVQSDSGRPSPVPVALAEFAPRLLRGLMLWGWNLIRFPFLSVPMYCFLPQRIR